MAYYAYADLDTRRNESNKMVNKGRKKKTEVKFSKNIDDIQLFIFFLNSLL